MKLTTFLLLLLSASIFAADKITITPNPSYTGGGSKAVVKDSSGKVVATGKSQERPKYLGGGTVTTITPVGGKKETFVEVKKPKFLGGGSEIKKK